MNFKKAPFLDAEEEKRAERPIQTLFLLNKFKHLIYIKNIL